MKRVFMMILALCALTMGGYATNYYYKCGVTKVEYEDQSYTKDGIKRNIYKVTINHTGKNMNGYSNTTVYDATVTFYLTSDDGTLDGTYTTEGFESIGSTYDKNYINYDNTKVKVVGYDERSLHPDYVSTLVINKEAGENQFSIGECTFYATNSKFTKQHRYTYYYCYDVDDIQNPNVALKPFVFGIQTEYVQQVYNYDMTVNGISVIRDDSDYDAIRYFLTLSCVGKNRDTNAERNYEVQLAIYPSSESIVGTFATQGGNLLYSSNSYVKDLKANKTRNLANDSISSIQIKSKGENQYSFYGGTLTCTDIDANYSAVYGKKRIEAVHYYHFSDNDGEGIPFGYDESSTDVTLTANNISIEPTVDGLQLTIATADGNSISYSVFLELESENIEGTFTYTSGLSAWSKVERGTNGSYVDNGSTVTINANGNGQYTISGNLLCENGTTYILQAFDFNYSTTGIENLEFNAQTHKVLREGQLFIHRGEKMFNAEGKQVQ